MTEVGNRIEPMSEEAGLTTIIKDVLRLRGQKKAMEATLEEIDDELVMAEQIVLDMFKAASIDSMKVDGQLLYVERKTVCKQVDVTDGADPKAVLLAALRKARLGSFIQPRVDLRTVTAHFKELWQSKPEVTDINALIPRALKGVVEFFTMPALRVRNGK